MLAALVSLKFCLLLCLLLRVGPAASVLTNRTIDDTLGDPITGLQPTYSPPDKWAPGQQCPTCKVHAGTTVDTIDVTQVFNGTWHDSTYDVDGPESIVTVSFKGTAVYVFNIIANNVTNGSTTTFTNLTFWIDGALVGSYTHTPGTTEAFEYNVLVYSNESLAANQNHALEMHAGGATKSLVLFDRIVYTTEADSSASGSITPFTTSNSRTSNSTTSPSSTSASKSSTPIGAIVGGVVGGVAAIALLAVLAFCILRRRAAARRPPSMAQVVDPFIIDQAGAHRSRSSNRRSSRAPILPSLRLGRTRLMPRGPGSTATTEASSSAQSGPDSLQGHRPRLPPMSPEETARSREQAEYSTRIQALEAQVRALEVQQQLGAGSDSSGSRTQLSNDSSQRTRGSSPRNRSGRSGNASTANLRSELNSLRNEIAALRGELSQDQLGFVEPAPTYMS